MTFPGRLEVGEAALRRWLPDEAERYLSLRDEVIFSWTAETIGFDATVLAQRFAAVTSSPICLAVVVGDDPIGNVTLNEGKDGWEISYWLAAAARGRGIGSAAVQAAVSWLLANGAHRVWARVHPENAASRSVLERSGFRATGMVAAPHECDTADGLVVGYERHPVLAVIFDLGGVVLESPLSAIAEYEQETGIRAGLINQTVYESGKQGAWARLERGEVSRIRFLELFTDELSSHGVSIDAASLMERVDASTAARPTMLAVVRRLRESGIKVAALTNNWVRFPSDGLRAEFDVFVESIAEGVRKPEPEIYRRCLQRLGVHAINVVMFDDLGPNLKPARDLGMTTMKFADVGQVLAVLEMLTSVGDFSLEMHPG